MINVIASLYPYWVNDVSLPLKVLGCGSLVAPSGTGMDLSKYKEKYRQMIVERIVVIERWDLYIPIYGEPDDSGVINHDITNIRNTFDSFGQVCVMIPPVRSILDVLRQHFDCKVYYADAKAYDKKLTLDSIKFKDTDEKNTLLFLDKYFKINCDYIRLPIESDSVEISFDDIKAKETIEYYGIPAGIKYSDYNPAKYR